MGNFTQDLKYALRTLGKNPGFTIVAILTLALGIGANTAIFSLTDQVLLRRLPVEKPDELVILRSPGPSPGRNWNDGPGGTSFSYPAYKDLRDQNPVLSGLLARFSTQVSVVAQGSSELATGELVTGNYFTVLGVQPAMGRVFGPEDETAPGANSVVVLSYGYWKRRFGLDPNILNKQMVVNGHSLTVVGVSRAGFSGVQVGQVPDLFIPMTLKAQMTPNWDGLADRDDHWLALIGRLKPGMSAARAEAGIAPTYHAMLETESPAKKHDSKTRQEFLDRKLILDPGSKGRPILQHDTKGPLLALMGMVGLVLLIACANLASLLVARAEARQKEIALRLALGAGRWRLVRQLIAESLVLAFAGGTAGVMLASWTLGLIVKLIPEDSGGAGLTGQLDYRVLIFAATVSILTGVLFGLAPALRATRSNIQTILKDQGSNVSAGKENVRTRKFLLASQIALTVVLLAAAGLFAHSLLNLSRQDLGVRPDHVLQFSVAPELIGYTPQQSVALIERMRKSIVALPGVRAVSASEIPMLASSDSSTNITVQGYKEQENENMDVDQNWVGPNFLSAMGVALLSGREFSESDTATAPNVAIVNEKFVQRFFAGRNPIGQHFGFGSGDEVHLDVEIVGVVKDSKNVDLRTAVGPYLLVPYSHSSHFGNATFYVRTNQDPVSLASAIRKTVRDNDDKLSVFGMRTLNAQVDDIVFTDRLVTYFSLGLALLASLLAAVGLYGVMAYVVARRTREIGIRMALGATRRNVAGMVLHEIAAIAAVGLVVGLTVAYAVGRVMESLLFGVKAGDPFVFVAATALLIVVAVLAGWLPARSAAGVDPMVALRYE
ncbi:MAG TPA: ABC transporter permease [Candidatus Acidoferrales bacterium]